MDIEELEFFGYEGDCLGADGIQCHCCGVLRLSWLFWLCCGMIWSFSRRLVFIIYIYCHAGNLILRSFGISEFRLMMIGSIGKWRIL